MTRAQDKKWWDDWQGLSEEQKEERLIQECGISPMFGTHSREERLALIRRLLGTAFFEMLIHLQRNLEANGFEVRLSAPSLEVDQIHEDLDIGLTWEITHPSVVWRL